METLWPKSLFGHIKNAVDHSVGSVGLSRMGTICDVQVGWRKHCFLSFISIACSWKSRSSNLENVNNVTVRNQDHRENNFHAHPKKKKNQIPSFQNVQYYARNLTRNTVPPHPPPSNTKSCFNNGFLYCLSWLVALINLIDYKIQKNNRRNYFP